MIEAIRPLIEKLRGFIEDPRARKIQSWVEYLSADPNKAGIIHNHTIDFLKKYHLKTREIGESDDIYKYAIQVANFIHSKDQLNFPPFNKDVYTTSTGIDMGADKKILKEQVMEYSKEILIASLFSMNRLGLEDRLSKSMELDQIKAVIKCVVDNNHIQMGTGQGKSSTVIPIVSIINSLTGEEKSSLVVSINKNLVTELEDKTKNLIKKAKKNNLQLPIFTKSNNQVDQPIGKNEKIKMMREALMSKNEKKYSDQLLKEVYTTYWGEILDSTVERKNDLFDQSTISFMSKDEFIFKVVHGDGGKDFLKSCPKVFFDEIDAPYIIGESYQSTHEDLYMSPENIQIMSTQYVLDKLVLSKLNVEEDFKVFKGKGILREETQERLKQIKWQSWLIGETKDVALETAFEESIPVIGNFLHLNESDFPNLRETIQHNLINHFFVGEMKEKMPEEEPNQIFVNIIDAASNLANAYHSLNKLYLDEGDQIVVRSSYFDQLLENHKFEPDSHIAMLALANKFNIVNLHSKASESAKFPTIIASLGNKLVGFSGTLKQRDLKTGKPQASPLAKLLKEYTGNEIYEVRSTEIKSPPSPYITENIAEMKKTLIEYLNINDKNQPILLISHYDTKTTQKIFTQLTQSFGNSFEVDILPSIPSDPKKLDNYYKILKNKTKELADNKTRILVSTGSIGIGADITKSDYTFPNLKIGILGLPENESQLRQNLGRRRKEGDDFFWITDKESLRERATWLDDQKTMIIKAFLTEKKALEQINKLTGNDTKNLDFVLKLIHDAHLATLTDESFIVDYDQMFKRGFLPQAKNHLIEKIKNEFFEEQVDWEKDEKARKKLFQLVDLFGLPDTLYDELVRTENTIGIKANSASEYISRLNSIQRNIIEKEIDYWFDSTKKDVVSIYHNFYNEGQGNINQIILTGSPTNTAFIKIDNKIDFGNLVRENTQYEIGYTTLNSDKFPKSVPGMKITQNNKIYIYLIKNIDFAQIRKISNFYAYKKGDEVYYFTFAPN